MKPTHPLAEVFPQMPAGDFDELCASIQRDGLARPIVLLDGQILDGRHRARACEAVGHEPDYIDYDGDSPETFVVIENLHRRHLTTSQRAVIASALLPHFEAAAKRRKIEAGRRALKAAESTAGGVRHEGAHPASTGSKPHRATDDVAESVGVSPRSAERAARVAKASPELAEKVKAGEITLGQAEKQIKPKPAVVVLGHAEAERFKTAALALLTVQLQPADLATVHEHIRLVLDRYPDPAGLFTPTTRPAPARGLGKGSFKPIPKRR